MKKKLVCLFTLLALVLTLGLGLRVNAANSPTTGSPTSGIVATDDKGNVITDFDPKSIAPLSDANIKSDYPELLNLSDDQLVGALKDELKNLGFKYSEDAVAVEQVFVVDPTPQMQAIFANGGKITLTFNVAVNDDNGVIVVHKDEAKGWISAEGADSNGNQVTADFSSLCPIAIMSVTDNASERLNNTMTWIIVAVEAVIVIVLVILYLTKKNKEEKNETPAEEVKEAAPQKENEKEEVVAEAKEPVFTDEEVQALKNLASVADELIELIKKVEEGLKPVQEETKEETTEEAEAQEPQAEETEDEVVVEAKDVEIEENAEETPAEETEAEEVNEEAETEDEDDEDDDDNNDEGAPEVVVVDAADVELDENGEILDTTEELEGDEYLEIAYNTSFLGKIASSSDDVKAWYSDIKNACLSYGMKAKSAWKFEVFNKGRNKLVKLVVKGKTLTMLTSLTIEDYEGTKFQVKASGKGKSSQKFPTKFQVNGSRKGKYAVELVDFIAQKLEIPKAKKFEAVDYVQEFGNETEKTLIDKGLIKVITNRETEANPRAHQVKMYKATTVYNIHKKMSDRDALNLVGHSPREIDRTKQAVLYTDQLAEYFDDSELVTLDEIKKRVPDFDQEATCYKIKPHGKLNKALVIDADEFTLGAAKMIILVGGKLLSPSEEGSEE